MKRFLAAVLALFAMVSNTADASAGPDQQCVPAPPRTGYYGTVISQSFQPSKPTVGGVDVLMGATTSMSVRLRVRLVGRRVLPEGFSAQVVVLADRYVSLRLPAYRATWAKVRLPSTMPWAQAGPAVDEYAVEVALPTNDDRVFWLNCDGYRKGHAAADVDAGSAAATDTKTALTGELPRDMAFVVYSTNR